MIFLKAAAHFCLALLLGDSLLFPLIEDSPPQITSPVLVQRTANNAAPLAAVLTFETAEPAMVALEINRVGPFVIDRELSIHHSVPVLGLRAGASNPVDISLIDGWGRTTFNAVHVDIQTDPLPADFPPITVTTRDEREMEPGITLFNMSPTGGPRFGWIVAVDNQGYVVWYYRDEFGVGEIKQLKNGDLLYIEGTDAVEIDMLGHVVRHWTPTGSNLPAPPGGSTPVNLYLFHHDLSELPSGNLLTISTDLRRIDSFPSSETDPTAPPGPANVVGDDIVELDRNGAIVNRWSLFDLIDPSRIGYDSLSASWNSFYPVANRPTLDWTHANSVTYDPSDESFIVSMRHQDAVIKFRRKDGQLVWILGNPGGWNVPWNNRLLHASGALDWPYHQHAPVPTPLGTLLMFDNGNYRARPFSAKIPIADSYSRIVEYRVDPVSMTVSQIWSYGGPGQEMFYSSALGSAKMLPLTHNILFTDGFRSTDVQGKPASGPIGISQWARVVEVTHDVSPRKVFELVVGNPFQPSPFGWSVYRSQRLESLYRLH